MGRNGTGVRAISDSSIELTFSYRGIRCRERLKLKPTAANLKRAGDFLGAVRDAITKGTFVHHYPGESSLMEVLKGLSSADRWVSYVQDCGLPTKKENMA